MHKNLDDENHSLRSFKVIEALPENFKKVRERESERE